VEASGLKAGENAHSRNSNKWNDQNVRRVHLPPSLKGGTSALKDQGIVG
jgi:hypothetical protein